MAGALAIATEASSVQTGQSRGFARVSGACRIRDLPTYWASGIGVVGGHALGENRD
jgi:hypothetical protein